MNCAAAPSEDTERAHTFSLADYSTLTDDKSDATHVFQKLFADVANAGGGNVLVPPGNYFMAGRTAITLPSHTHVVATGAKFRLPELLGDKARVVLFKGENVRDFSWVGGSFHGSCFDPGDRQNTWEPNANTRVFLITTTANGVTEDILFRDVKSDGIAGAVINVFGLTKPGSESDVQTFARNVTVENCTLLNSGKFMWDYGYLWQITVWPEDYSEGERRMAAKYYPTELIRSGLTMADGDDRVRFDNSQQPLAVSKNEEPQHTLCLYGDLLPENLQRGRQYFVVESEPGHIKIAGKAGGAPIRFQGNGGAKTKLIHDLFRGYLALYEPIGSGPGKGGVDLVACQTVRVSGCKLSARGDTMHIQKCHNIIFANNQIVGSRMGAFFLAEYCKNATVTGNTVDGANGSRVMSVEKSCEDVTILGNTFRNGGRGSWINQPRNFVLADNIFVNNTTKCERDPRRGRRSFVTGDYERYAELYFTTYEPGGCYGHVAIRGNIFTSGTNAAHAITFAPGGDTILVTDNIFAGPVRDIPPATGCDNVTIHENVELQTKP